MRMWRNWQTRQVQVLVSFDVKVRVLSSAQCHASACQGSQAQDQLGALDGHSGCGAVGSAPRLGRGGPKFESQYPDTCEASIWLSGDYGPLKIKTIGVRLGTLILSRVAFTKLGKSLISKRRIRAISSVGSEHLVYTEGVGSSSLSSPTEHQHNQIMGVSHSGYCS